MPAVTLLQAHLTDLSPTPPRITPSSSRWHLSWGTQAPLLARESSESVPQTLAEDRLPADGWLEEDQTISIRHTLKGAGASPSPSTEQNSQCQALCSELETPGHLWPAACPGHGPPQTPTQWRRGRARPVQHRLQGHRAQVPSYGARNSRYPHSKRKCKTTAITRVPPQTAH